MNSQIEKITNQEKNEKNIKIIQFEDPLSLKISDFSIQNLIDSFKKNEELNNILIRRSSDEDILEINDWDLKFLGLIFLTPIKVTFEKAIIGNEYFTVIDKKVYSNIQIEENLNKFNIIYPNIIDADNKLRNYFDSIDTLYWNIRNKEIKIINSFKECKFKENKIILLNKVSFTKEDLSKYFDDYFIYPNDEKTFKFYPTPNRKNLEENCSILINKEEITQFKITGPSGEGKSISLLYFSRCSYNKIYLNLKTIYNLYSSKNIEKYLDLLIHEFGRLYFKDPAKKILFENVFNKYSFKNFWELLEQISLILKGHKVLFIFDQFKEKFVDRKYYERIKENLKGDLKLIISSSINDHEIGNATANSLIKHKDDLFKLTKDNQNDYFYYSDLVNINDLKQLFNIKDEKKINLYNYFGWNPKYIKLISDGKSKEELKGHIIKKFEEHCLNLGIEFELYIFNIFLRINRQTNYNIIPLKTLSLKYCKLKLEKNVL